MRVLAIDTSCDESCASVLDVKEWKLLSDVVYSHVEPMKAYGGVVPEIACREHLKGLPLAVHEALEKSGTAREQIDWVTVSNRPGLIGALMVGVSFAKAFAYGLNKPFSVLNHIEAHLFSPLLASTEGQEVPSFPWIALVVSGGHTELFLVKDKLDYEWLGGTLDDAAGEAFDKIGKLLKLPYPAGPQIDKWVRESAADEDRKKFAFPRAKTKDYQFSFSGLKTSVANQINKLGDLDDDTRLAVAASAQEAIVDSLVKQLVLAKKNFGVNQIVVTGGVACNSRLRAKLPGALFPKPRHCTDNAAMVALLSGLYLQDDKLKPSSWDTTATPYIDF